MINKRQWEEMTKTDKYHLLKLEDETYLGNTYRQDADHSQRDSAGALVLLDKERGRSRLEGGLLWFQYGDPLP